MTYRAAFKDQEIVFECPSCVGVADAFCDCFSLARAKAQALGLGAHVERNGRVLAHATREYLPVATSDAKNDRLNGVVRHQRPRTRATLEESWRRGTLRSARAKRGMPSRRRAA